MQHNNHHAAHEKIHVLHLLGNAIVGGMENYVRSLLQALPANTFDITCLCPYESPITAELRRGACEVFVSPVDPDPTWQSVQTVVGIIRSRGIHLLHAHLPPAHRLAGLAGALARRPVLATIHGMSDPDSIGIQRLVGSHLAVICHAAYMEAVAWGVPREKLTLIRNGVDLQRFSPRPDGADFRRAVGIPPDAPLVGFVGRLSWEKGPDQFVRAAAIVHEARPDVHFALVGEGPMAAELQEQIAAQGLAGCVHLAGLWPDVAPVYPAFDVLAQTSRAEGMPLALLEGMACARPYAGMGVGGVLEIVRAGVTGLLAAPGDWHGLGRALLQLLADPDRACQMGQAARQHVAHEFSLQNTASQTAALYRRLVQAALPPLSRPGDTFFNNSRLTTIKQKETRS
ncbi:MAG: glycosyltransferase family 4 protein [Anaerolineales bacterium]|nr:glycosyltransferase family 4 protein [Anaerolineales bacterium]